MHRDGIRNLAAFVLLVGVVLAAPASWAQEDDATEDGTAEDVAEPGDEQNTPDEETEEPSGDVGSVDHSREAIVLSRQAQEAFDAGDIPRAITLYEQAFDNYPDPAFALNLAQLYEYVEELPQAFEYYTAFIELWPDAPNVSDVQARLDAVEAELESNWALVRVTSEPEGAEVYLIYDQAEYFMGPTPFARWFPAEDVSFRVESGGHHPSSIDVTPEIGSDAEPIHVVLEELPPPPPPPAPDYRRTATAGYITLGTGVALAAGGVALWSLSAEEDDEETPEDEGATTTAQTIGLAIAGTGVAALLGGLALIVLDETPDEDSAMILPMRVRGGAGAIVRMRF